MTILYFVIGSLAVFRISTIISKEKGPWFLFCRLRKVPKSGSAMAVGLSCPLCVSVYASAFITALFWMRGLDGYLVVPIWLGLSGASVVLSLTVGKNL